MKAKDIKRLRAKVSGFKEYEVSYTGGLFGDWSCGGICSMQIMASNAEEAVQRYLKWYWRTYKNRNPHHTNTLVETTYQWGKFRVEDSRGYTRYFM